MKSTLLFLAISFLLVISVSVDAFAQSDYDVNIPTGAASPDAPYFWQSEKDGDTSGVIDILVGDSVIWKNADTAMHTVTSGVVPDADNVFDSGMLGPGKSFPHTFVETGTYPYFCIVHPWMDGVITVTAGYSIIPNVGKEIGDGSVCFEVEYGFNRLLSNAIINEDQKSITFEIIGNAKSDNHDLKLLLPTDLIDGPFVIWVDNEKLVNFEHVLDESMNTLIIPLSADSKTFTIIGTSIVPEFGPIVVMVLVVSIVSMLFLSQRFKLGY